MEEDFDCVVLTSERVLSPLISSIDDAFFPPLLITSELLLTVFFFLLSPVEADDGETYGLVLAPARVEVCSV